MGLTWRNKCFQLCKTGSGYMAHGTDDKGVIVFRWRMYLDEELYEEFIIPFGVVEQFETFKALCRQFDTPEDAQAWLNKKVTVNDC